jgi:poly-gamma-glutamate capsule biosynthesis protein CapA/YwtB (metallophosphatase superfamily)
MGMGEPLCTLFLCGDVMTGRGVDQVLQHPSRPKLYEPMVKSAIEYVHLAERAHGSIPRRVAPTYIWGAALEELERRKPSARIINLETSITTSEDAEPKGINYRMHPDNVRVLTAAGIDCATIANNHALDWGLTGLRETLATLTSAGIRTAGAGSTFAEAETPAVIDAGVNARILVLALGAFDSGVPAFWSAADDRPGVHWFGDYSTRTVARVAQLVTQWKRDGDVAVLSIHWGPNWGYEIPSEHRRFAKALIDDAGIDLVFGHSSHHPKAIELHRGHAILYGCGDFMNDYEGIPNHDAYRHDISLMYFPTIDLHSGELAAMEMVPLLIRNFRLQLPSSADIRWVRDMLDGECRRVGRRVAERATALRLE